MIAGEMLQCSVRRSVYRTGRRFAARSSAKLDLTLVRREIEQSDRIGLPLGSVGRFGIAAARKCLTAQCCCADQESEPRRILRNPRASLSLSLSLKTNRTIAFLVYLSPLGQTARQQTRRHLLASVRLAQLKKKKKWTFEIDKLAWWNSALHSMQFLAAVVACLLARLLVGADSLIVAAKVCNYKLGRRQASRLKIVCRCCCNNNNNFTVT